MQFDQLRAFVRCAELGSLSGAARAEGIAKSSLSRLLSDLERDLKVELLSRTSRGVVPTEEGRMFLAHARQILEDVAAATAAVRHPTATPSGVIRFTAPYTFGVTFIAPRLPAFLRAYPSIAVHVELTSRNVDLAAEGFDVGIRIGTPPPDMVARRVMSNPIILCASKGYLAHAGAPMDPAELAAHPLLLIGAPRSGAMLRLSRAGVVSLVTTPPKLVSTDPAVVLQAALQGVGVGQVPVILARGEIERGDLVRVLPDWTMPQSEISIIYPAGRAVPPRVRAFVTYIGEALEQDDLSRNRPKSGS